VPFSVSIAIRTAYKHIIYASHAKEIMQFCNTMSHEATISIRLIDISAHEFSKTPLIIGRLEGKAEDTAAWFI
jgi:hypothetical protein